MIGTGHLMRCLTLASALREEGATCIFICRAHSTSLNDLVRKQGFTLHELPQAIEPLTSDCLGVAKLQDAEETKNVIQGLPDVPDWLIVDHYGIDEEWERELRPFVKRIFVIDDLANRPHDCDILLDQNYTHNWNRYEGLVPEHCRLFLGPEYALLRSEFITARQKLEQQGWSQFDPRKVFVFFGGMDPQNYTGRALKILRAVGDFAPEVVIGRGNVHREEIENEMQFFPEGHLHIQTNQMAEIMLRCSWYLGSGGSITWERMCLGLTGIVLPISEDQISLTEALVQDGLAFQVNCLDDIRNFDLEYFYKFLKQSNHLCIQMVDGEGTKRICIRMLNRIDKEKLAIRKADYQDAIRLFLWANDPVVRSNSWNSQTISMQKHLLWFYEKLIASNSKIYIIEHNKLPIGQVRYDLIQGTWLIDYSIASCFRGCGLGKHLLDIGEAELKRHTECTSFKLKAEVKRCNQISIACLQQNGYRMINNDDNSERLVFLKVSD